MIYKINLILNDKDIKVLIKSLKDYNGKDKLTPECIKELITRQVEIQRKEQNNENNGKLED